MVQLDLSSQRECPYCQQLLATDEIHCDQADCTEKRQQDTNKWGAGIPTVPQMIE